jgi:RND family efflux transporter MFP subunit
MQKNNVNKAYTDAFNAVSSAYIDLSNIMSGLKDLFYSQEGYLSDQNATKLSPTSRTYRDTAGLSYDRAVEDYATSLASYKNINRSSATSTIIAVIEKTQNTVKNIAEALKNTQNAVTYISTYQPEYSASAISSAASNVTAWSNTINNDLSNIVSSRNSIESNNNTLQTLITGADSLDIASAKLTLAQKQQNYAEYFIRAPFDGVVGKIPVNVYDEASGGTVIATIVGDNKTSTISLNEVDAAKVAAGQKVTLTFDAIDNLNATGTVREADLVGTVTQGVVTYNVKIDINTNDNRVKPGMSVNATIITGTKEHVLIVPTSAIKSQGTSKYVEILDGISTSTTNRSSALNRASSTMRTLSGGNDFVQTRTITITSNSQPRQQTIEVGESDDTNTEIISGLKVGDKIVTKTITSSTSKTTTTTPNILSGLGGNRTTGAGGATRIGR